MSDDQQVATIEYSIAHVALDVAVDKILDYSIPTSLIGVVKPGMRVEVPLRNRREKGLVLALKKESPYSKIQSIIEVLSQESIVSDDLLQLAKFIANYYVTSERKVFQTILPKSLRNDQKDKTQFYVKKLISQKKLIALCQTLRPVSSAQAKVLDVILKYPKGILLSKLLEEADISKSPVQTLVTKKILSMEKLRIDRSILEDEEFFQTKPKLLNDQQAISIGEIKKAIDKHYYQTYLLHGITGSGKTEVYLQAMQFAREKGLGIILLVPEIALTSQTIERLKSRFTEPIAVFHHRLSDGQRIDTWKAIKQGKIHIVIGARSAIFSPLQNLGLIIIDEEHDSSYKQSEEMPCYHARDIAVVRGKINHIPVILGTATPSFESFTNAKKGKFQLLSLDSRASNAKLPNVSIINMKQEYEKSQGFTLFSDALLRGIKQRLDVGEQTLLFLNRRGYHTSQICLSCSQVVSCPHCDLSLTFHRSENYLSCHLCSYSLTPPPKSCKKCGSSNTMKFRGAGTEQVQRALYALFPEIRVLRMDADTTRHKGSHDKIFKQFRSGKADILVGTQMIAKGLHFPSVTLVGILNSDSALNIPDFRSSEYVFQLICQVSGRSGRSDLQGEVIIQTTMPDHPVIRLAAESNYHEFYDLETPTREMFQYPPFAKLVRIIFKGKDPKEVSRTAQNYHQQLVKLLPSHFTLHPVMPCTYAKIKDTYRFHFLIKGNDISPLNKILRKIREENSFSKEIRILIDIDPISTFF